MKIMKKKKDWQTKEKKCKRKQQDKGIVCQTADCDR